MPIDEWTQDSVWYNALPIFEKWNVNLPTRKHLKSLIRGVCKKLGVTRERIGIVAAPWATMYYRGQWYSVSFETLGWLAERGTDMIFIEKLDIVKVEGKYADKWGIALVNSRGHLSEYAEDLATPAEASGAHVAISADYDIPGIIIIAKLIRRGVLWLGVNEEMLQYFGISKQDKNRVVPYNPKKKRIRDEKLEELVYSSQMLRMDTDIEFLKRWKVELDAVLTEVGSERLFDYYLMQLKKKYPKRDYTRVIKSKPPLEHHYPKAIRFWNQYISKHVDSLVKEESEKIESENKDVEGFIDVPEKEKEIDKRLGDIIEADQHFKDIAVAIEGLARQQGYDLSQFEAEEQEKHPGVKDEEREQNDRPPSSDEDDD